MDKIRVAVLYGGQSDEHEVSVASAQTVLDQLKASPRYQVCPVVIRKDSVWTLPDYADDSHNAAHTSGGPVIVSAGASLVGVDVVWPVLHGEYGEDGTVQGLLELAGLPYVGCGVFASAAAMDKEYTKRLLHDQDLPIAPCAVMRPNDTDIDHEVKVRLGLPVFVKPATGGSSIGVSKVEAWADLHEAVAAAREVSRKVIVEQAIKGREVEVAVLEYPDGTVAASQPAEIHAAGWYDYRSKYTGDSAKVTVPADLKPGISDLLREAAVAAFHTLGCRGLARVDFFVLDDGVVINEINTMPGFTDKSVYPAAWAASDVDFGTLVDTLIDTAIARHCNG